MAVITDNTNSEGVEVNLPETFDGNNRDAEEAASTSSYEEDTISSAGDGKSWRIWNSINRMNIFMVLCLFILGLTAGLSTTAAKSNVVDNMSSTTKARKASKGPTAKSTKAPACVAVGDTCVTSEECCVGGCAANKQCSDDRA